MIANNLKTQASAGSLLVRSMLTKLKEHLYLVSTPAYDPDANRIAWLWRISRRVGTHNHQRRTFELLLADLQTRFQTPKDLGRGPSSYQQLVRTRQGRSFATYPCRMINLEAYSFTS
jgi:hypothetical protein